MATHFAYTLGASQFFGQGGDGYTLCVHVGRFTAVAWMDCPGVRVRGRKASISDGSNLGGEESEIGVYWS